MQIPSHATDDMMGPMVWVAIGGKAEGLAMASFPGAGRAACLWTRVWAKRFPVFQTMIWSSDSPIRLIAFEEDPGVYGWFSLFQIDSLRNDGRVVWPQSAGRRVKRRGAS